MSFTVYDASIPVMIHTLESLSKILDKAVAQANERDMPLSELLDARLAPDMFPLTRQIQIATDSVKGCAARLTGNEVPSFEDNEASFPELQERIAKTIAYVKGFTPEQFEGSETRKIEIKTPRQSFEFIGRDFLTRFVLPNLYFHVTTAYALLRHKGIEIGKFDYLGVA